MLFKGICWLLPVLVASVTAAPHERRSIQTGRRVLAYGENITGFALYADTDGFAVIANPKNDNSELFEASWTVDTDGALAWNVSFSVPHNASANVTEDAASFYILPDADFAQSGFTVNGSIPDGAATEGFVLYGHDIMFSSGDSLQSKFWAQNTSNGYWNLVWNTEGSSKSDSVPVMLMTDDDDDDSSS